MRILLTGASGRVGRALTKKLSVNSEALTLSRGEFNDPAAIEARISKDKPDTIVHLAALLHEQCEADPQLAEDINVTKTKQLAALAAKYGVSKFIFASTAAIYHQTDLAPTDEDSNIAPSSVYAKTKRQAEASLEKLAGKTDTNFLVFRIFNIYGPEFDDSLVNKLVKSSEANQPTVLGPENYYRDYIHISDVAEAFLLGIKSQPGNKFQILNISSGQVKSNSELIDEIKEKGHQPVYRLKKIDSPNISWADISRAKDTLGFDPGTELDLSGIA